MRTIGFWLFVLVWLASLAVGALYLFTPDVLPYHAEALGGTAATLPPRVVAFYFGVMRVMGTLALALGLVSAYLLFARIRHGDSLAALVFVAAASASSIASGLVAFYIHQTTGANTPWQIPAASFAVLMIAYFLWLPPTKKAD